MALALIMYDLGSGLSLDCSDLVNITAEYRQFVS